MFKNKKVLLVVLLLLSLIVPNKAFASNNKTQLQVVEKSSETKYLEDDQGYITKTIVDSNPDTGEVTVELRLNNKGKEQEQNKTYENTEIYILVSENLAKDNEKLTKYINDIGNLASKIFSINTKTKIGIIGIKGTIRDWTINDDGKAIFGDKDEGKINGTAENAEIVVELTNDLDKIKSNLQNMNSSQNKYYTNLQAAIRLANNSYSSNTNKILISLYDAVPDIAIGVHSMVSYGGFLSEYATIEEAVNGKYEKIATYTKNEILTLNKSNVSFILLRPDDTSYDENWYSTTSGELTLEFDGSPYVQKLYGTIDNPTYGKMYSFDNSSIDAIINENIYQDVKELIQADINNVKIVDYFPEDITENFEFSYVGDASLGTASDKIDEEKKTIEWNIGTLKGNETATLKYKLKIKDMQNTELLNKTIATNEKVILTYKDNDEKEHELTLTSSPKIKLQEIVEKEGDDKKDNTMATSDLPNTGKILLVWIIGIITVSTIVAYIRYKKLYM